MALGNTCGLGFFQLSLRIDYRRLDWCSLPLICSSSLPLLHTAMPTPCLNTFSHSDPYSIWKCFLSQVFSVDILLVWQEAVRRQETNSYPALTLTLDLANSHYLTVDDLTEYEQTAGQTTSRSRCHRITRINSTRFSRLWHKQAQKLTPDGEYRSLWRSSASFPGGSRVASLGTHG